MKIFRFFVLLSVLLLFNRCKKEYVPDYPDLSIGGVVSVVEGKGLWSLSYQDIDSISEDSVVYLNKDWPNKVGGLIEFHLLKMDNTNRKYFHITEFEYWGTKIMHVDTVFVSPDDDIISLKIYYSHSTSIEPTRSGTFKGRYDPISKQIKGYLKHGVSYRYWISPYPWRYYRSATAVVNAICN
ncbi:MAG: hypothetical protein WC150_14120 [Bacteroidia bacterium]